MIGEIEELGVEAYGDRMDLIPIQSTHSHRGKAWFINSVPTTYLWFWKLRQQLIKRIQALAEEERYETTNRPASVWDGIDTTGAFNE
jgi:hypothetical protein